MSRCLHSSAQRKFWSGADGVAAPLLRCEGDHIAFSFPSHLCQVWPSGVGSSGNSKSPRPFVPVSPPLQLPTQLRQLLLWSQRCWAKGSTVMWKKLNVATRRRDSQPSWYLQHARLLRGRDTGRGDDKAPALLHRHDDFAGKSRSSGNERRWLNRLITLHARSTNGRRL